MDNQVFEEAPVAVGGDAARQIEKHARQLAYDTRYFVKKQLGGKAVNAATMEKLLLQRLQKSTAVPAVKARAKEMLVGKTKKSTNVAMEDYQIQDLASDTLAKAMFKVFVEGVNKEENIELNYIKELFDSDKTKYKIRVTDVKNGTSYVRFATLDKISQLRAKGLKVEKTEHGDPREDEAKGGSQTAAALGGGEKAKKDYDGDGKIESPAKEHAGAVHNAIQRKRGLPADGQDTSSVKEDFIGELATDLPTARSNGRKVTGFVDNSSLVKVFPEDKSDPTTGGPGSSVQQSQGQKQPMTAGYEMNGSFIAEKNRGNALNRFSQLVMEKAESEQQQKLFGLALSVKRGETPRSEVSAEVLKIVDTMSEKKIRDFAKTKHKGLPKKVEEAKEVESKKDEECGCEDDPRSRYAQMEVIKNRLRAKYGIKNPIVMAASYEPEGEVLDERRRGDRGKPRPDTSSLSHRVMLSVREKNKTGLMTRGGQTVAQHEAQRGVKKDRTGPVEPQPPTQTPEDKLARRKAAAERSRQEAERMMSSSRD